MYSLIYIQFSIEVLVLWTFLVGLISPSKTSIKNFLYHFLRNFYVNQKSLISHEVKRFRFIVKYHLHQYCLFYLNVSTNMHSEAFLETSFSCRSSSNFTYSGLTNMSSLVPLLEQICSNIGNSYSTLDTSSKFYISIFLYFFVDSTSCLNCSD